MTADDTTALAEVRNAVASYICNVSNLPKPMQTSALGLHMGDLIDGLTERIAPLLATARAEAADEAPVCSHCPPSEDCTSCEPDDCECYAHQDEPDKRFPVVGSGWLAARENKARAEALAPVLALAEGKGGERRG